MPEPSFEFLTVDEPLESVMRITVERPPVNALSRALVSELAEATELPATRNDLRAVVLAAGGKAFCAGADLVERRKMSDPEVVDAVAGIGRMVRKVAQIPVPTIAAVQGAALGGGLELALGCDLRVAAASASLGLPECSLAIIPGAGGTQRLPRLIGPARAKRWIFTARVASASEALEDGVVDVVAEDAELEQAVLELGRQMTRCGPLALRAAKRAIDSGLEAPDLESGLAEESRAYATTIPTRDRAEALRAFAEKRAPRFTGE
jgi:enoyl-CoA hydratase/carnithine racemase